MFKVFDFIRRPIVGANTTEALVYRKPVGYPNSYIAGAGGQTIRRNMNATSIMGIVPYRTARIVDPTVNGNPPGVFDFTPLVDVKTTNIPQF